MLFSHVALLFSVLCTSVLAAPAGGSKSSAAAPVTGGSEGSAPPVTSGLDSPATGGGSVVPVTSGLEKPVTGGLHKGVATSVSVADLQGFWIGSKITIESNPNPKNLGEMIEVKEDEIASSMTPTYLEKTYWSGSNRHGRLHIKEYNPATGMFSVGYSPGGSYWAKGVPSLKFVHKTSVVPK